MKIDGLILDARANKCSDIHISVGMPLMYRINGRLMEIPASNVICFQDNSNGRKLFSQVLYIDSSYTLFSQHPGKYPLSGNLRPGECTIVNLSHPTTGTTGLQYCKINLIFLRNGKSFFCTGVKFSVHVYTFFVHHNSIYDFRWTTGRRQTA